MSESKGVLFCAFCAYRGPGKLCPNDGRLLFPKPAKVYTPEENTRLTKRYKLLGVLQTGGQGTGFLAHDLRLNRKCFIRVADARVARDTDLAHMQARRYAREAFAAGLLQHPSNCRVLDFGITRKGLPFIVYEFLGTDCIHNAGGKVGIRVAIRMVLDICEALTEAHSLCLIHRDVKPENIMWVPDRRHDERGSMRRGAVLIDWGIVKLADRTEAEQATDDDQDSTLGHIPPLWSNRTITQDGCTAGTTEFAAPEQLCNNYGSVDVRTDIYSLGHVLYYLLTGTRAIPEASNHQIPERERAIAQVADPPVPLARTMLRDACESDVFNVLSYICDRALEKHQRDRFQSASEMHGTLSHVYSKTLPDVDSET